MKLPWYMIMDLMLCGMAIAAVYWAWPKMNRYWRWSALLTAITVMILQVLNELLSLHIFKAWEFSEQYSSLIGVNVWGAPLEEYLFWFPFAWMITFLYSGLSAKLDMSRRRNA